MSPGHSLRDQTAATLRHRIVSVALRPGQRLVERDLAAELDVSRIPVREALESLAAHLAAQRATPATIAPLRAALHAEEEAATTEEAEQITHAIVVFHAEVIGLAGNPLLTSTAQRLSARVEWLMRLTFDPDDHRYLSEHETLFELIAHGDADRAATFAWEHIEADRTMSIERARRWFVDGFDPDKVASTRRRRKNTSKDATPYDDTDTEPSPGGEADPPPPPSPA